MESTAVVFFKSKVQRVISKKSTIFSANQKYFVNLKSVCTNTFSFFAPRLISLSPARGKEWLLVVGLYHKERWQDWITNQYSNVIRQKSKLVRLIRLFRTSFLQIGGLENFFCCLVQDNFFAICRSGLLFCKLSLLKTCLQTQDNMFANFANCCWGFGKPKWSSWSWWSWWSGGQGDQGGWGGQVVGVVSLDGLH